MKPSWIYSGVYPMTGVLMQRQERHIYKPNNDKNCQQPAEVRRETWMSFPSETSEGTILDDAFITNFLPFSFF